MAAALPFIPVGLQIAGSLFGGATKATGQAQAGQAEATSALMQSRLSFLQQNAELNKGVEQEQMMRYNARNLLGAQRTGYAAEGVKLEGTPLLAMANTITQSSRDILLANQKTDAAALGFGFQGNMFQQIAANSPSAGNAAAGGSLLTGGIGALSAAMPLLSTLFRGGGGGAAAATDLMAGVAAI